MERPATTLGATRYPLRDHPALVTLELGRNAPTALGLALLGVDGLAYGGTRDLWLSVKAKAAVPCVEAVLAHTVARGMRTHLRVLDERWLSPEDVAAFSHVGLHRLVVTVASVAAELNDKRRASPGSFSKVRELVAATSAVGTLVHVETPWTDQPIDEAPRVLELVEEFGAAAWTLRFPVDFDETRLSARAAEQLLAILAERAERTHVTIDTCNAPHFRRITRQLSRTPGQIARATALRPALNDGRGLLCIDDEGQILPSESLRITCGSIRRDDPLEVYRFHPTFRTLRDTELFEGTCRTCEYRSLCGGSRARAYARTGKLLAADPLCDYPGQRDMLGMSRH